MKTIIIGGGVSGMAAATACVSRGQEVVLLEKQAHLGGRASTFREPRHGMDLDIGAHVILHCCRNVRRFLGEIGSESRLTFDDSSGIVPIFDLQSGKSYCLRNSKLPSPFHSAGALFGLGFSFGEILRALRFSLSVFVSGGSSDKLDGISVAEYLRKMGQTERMIYLLWGPLCISIMNEIPQRASAALFRNVLRIALFESRNAGRLAHVSGTLNDLFAGPAERFLKSRGADIRLKTKVRRLLLSGEGSVRGVMIQDGVEMPADKVIVAVPAWEFGSLVEGTPIEEMEFSKRTAGLSAGSILTAYLWTDRPLFTEPWFSLVGGTAEWVVRFGQDVLSDGTKAYRTAAVVSAADRIEASGEDRISEIIWYDLKRAFRPAGEAILYDTKVVRVVKAVPSFAPGAEILRPPTSPPVKNLYLAGDHVDTKLPGTLESAVLSGYQAAESSSSP